MFLTLTLGVIIVSVLGSIHCGLVDELEQKNCEDRSDVCEQQEDPGVLSFIQVALEKNGSAKTERSSGVVHGATHDSRGLSKANDGDESGSNDESGDGGVGDILVLSSV